ncbi:hypothetical protein K7432_018120, partial [Basidiobolus ranarum]
YQKTEKPDKSNEQDDLPRMFALTSEPSFKFRFISITPTGLKAFTTGFKKVSSAFNDNQDIEQKESRRHHAQNVFANLIKTDGYSADVVVYKPTPKHFDSTKEDYVIEDLKEALQQDENLNDFGLIILTQCCICRTILNECLQSYSTPPSDIWTIFDVLLISHCRKQSRSKAICAHYKAKYEVACVVKEKQSKGNYNKIHIHVKYEYTPKYQCTEEQKSWSKLGKRYTKKDTRTNTRANQNIRQSDKTLRLLHIVRIRWFEFKTVKCWNTL